MKVVVTESEMAKPQVNSKRLKENRATQGRFQKETQNQGCHRKWRSHVASMPAFLIREQEK